MLNDTDKIGLDQFLGSVGSRVPRDREPLLPIGAMLGSWRIESLVGRGGSGEVYRVVRLPVDGITGTEGTTGTDGRARTPAAPQSPENAAALKILWCDDEPSRQRFVTEGRLLAENQIPFLPRLIDSGEWEGRSYLVTELLEPIDLPSSDSAVAEYLLSVCEAVRALHLSGIVHRDLKPKNIMRRSSGEVVLIDFGLAKDTFVSARPRTDVSIVSGKAVGVGTPEYAAPEQLTGGEISPAADIHALGRIANAAFGGKPPRSWESIIRRATSSIPTQRYETVDDFATAIRNRNRFRNFILAGLAAAVFAVFAGVFFGRDELPLVRDVSTQMRFNAICETVATNIVTRQLLWEKLETNKFGMVYLKGRAFRNVTNAIDVTLVRLNRGTNVFTRPMQLKPNHEYWVVGPGILDASVASSGTNTTMRLKNCVFLNRSSVPFKNTGIRYVFQGGAYLNFTNMDRPEDFTTHQIEGFDGAFDEIRFKGESSERFKGLGVGEEVQKSHIENSVVVVISGLKRVVGDDELLEGVAGVSERESLLCPFFGVWDHVGGLDVDSTRPAVDDEVDFVLASNLFPFIDSAHVYDANIDCGLATNQFAVNRILHQVCQFHLSKVDRGIAKSRVDGVIFDGEVEIVSTANIIPLDFRNDEGVLQMRDHAGYGWLIGRDSGDRLDRIGEFVWIGRGGDGTQDKVGDMFHQLGVLDSVSFHNVAQVNGAVEIGEVIFLFDIGLLERTFGESAVDEIVVQSGEGIGTLRGELAVFGKRERSDGNDLSASTEFGRDIRCQQPRIGTGHIDIDIRSGAQVVQDIVESDIGPFTLFGRYAGGVDGGIPFPMAVLNLVNQDEITPPVSYQSIVDVIAQGVGGSQGLIGSTFQVDFNDVVFGDARFKQVPLEEFEQKITFAATANSRQNLDEVVTLGGDKLIQQFCSFDFHASPFVLKYWQFSVRVNMIEDYSRRASPQSVFNCVHSCRYFNTRIIYHTRRNNATANFFHFPRHILRSKHEYIVGSMKTKDTEVASNDESFDFHLDSNRIRTNAEIQLFADVFSISFDEARQILKKAGRQCQS